MADDNRAGSVSEGSLTISLTERSVTQPIGPELVDPAAKKFVKIQIAEVLNPKKIRITFEVRYERRDGEKTLLGSFALYPPDHPGEFIVATRGSLRNEGAIVVTMLVLDQVGPDDEVRVKIGKISFTDA